MTIFKKLSITFLLASTLVACKKDVVDLRPIDQIPAQVAIQNMNDVTSAVFGVYGTWAARRSHYISALISDEVRLGFGTEYRNVGNILFNWQHVSDSQDWRDAETGGVWTNLYQVIDRANRILELMVPVPTLNVTETNLKIQYRAELLALRAMAHLELLRNFSATAEYSPNATGVILMTAYAKAPGSFFPARSTQGQVMASIDADLAEAKALFASIPAFSDINRITKNAVAASQARAALHVKNWQGVFDRANEVLLAQDITPLAGYAALWQTRNLAATQTTEVIWKYSVTTANTGFAVGTLWQDVGGTAAVQASAAFKLTNSYDPVNDVRFLTFFTFQALNNRWLISKYGFNAIGSGELFNYDIKMIRASEILLARAEANAELNLLPAANNDLKKLRMQRITGYVHTDINDKATMITAIIQERYKELCYEGQRYYDLRRRSLPIARDISDVASNTAIQNLLSTDAKYLLPIPQQEFFANPNVGQNPGY